ncbi:MAG: RagB/SusD family nutrient uptake outer membrane protein [Bacteroidota bacterium]
MKIASINIFFFLFLLISGCKDFLTITPEDELSRAEVFSSLRGADAAVVGLYNLLGDENYYQTRFPIYADLAGNLAVLDDEQTISIEDINTDIRLTFVQAHALATTPAYLNSSLDNIYPTAYTLLYQTNDIIRGLEELQDGTEEQRSSLRGEALAIRALAHFDLVRLFAQSPAFSADASHPGIVLMEQLPEAADLPSRATVAEVYTSIRADLEAAESLIDESQSRRSSASLWLTPTVVQGLLARVAAYERDWSAVVEWANRCLENDRFELSNVGRYVEEWQAGTLTEMLWSLDLQRRVNDDASSESFITSPALICGSGNEDPFLQVSNDLLSLFPAGDIRRDLISQNADGDRLTDKWPRIPNAIRNIPMLRLSEIYLLRAEAAAELGQEDLANADLRVIRQRANLNLSLPDLTGDELRQAIRTERRLELAFEGHHLFDLNRWGEDLLREDCASFVIPCSLAYPDPRFILPIPQVALIRNPNLTQNEGY